MKYSLLAFIWLSLFYSCPAQELKSPNGNQVLTFMLQANGTPERAVSTGASLNNDPKPSAHGRRIAAARG